MGIIEYVLECMHALLKSLKHKDKNKNKIKIKIKKAAYTSTVGKERMSFRQEAQDPESEKRWKCFKAGKREC